MANGNRCVKLIRFTKQTIIVLANTLSIFYRLINTLSIQPNGTTDKMHDASPESCADGADIAVGFMLNSVVLCWQSVFEVGTSCTKNI